MNLQIGDYVRRPPKSFMDYLKGTIVGIDDRAGEVRVLLDEKQPAISTWAIRNVVVLQRADPYEVDE